MMNGIMPNLGFVAGNAAGAWAMAKMVKNVYHVLNPKHAALFAMSNAISYFIVHRLLSKNYGENAKSLQNIAAVCIATLLNLSAAAAVANALGIPLMLATAMRIAAVSLATGVLGTAAGLILAGSKQSSASTGGASAPPNPEGAGNKV